MRLGYYLAALLILVSVGCGRESSNSTNGLTNKASSAQLSHRIFAVSYPLQFLTQQIAGEEIEVLVPFGDSDDPRKFRPTREMIEAMQESDLVVANGIAARYAKWLNSVSLPESKIISTATHGLALRDYIQVKGESIVHSHGPEGEHSHPVMAAFTWLDPALAKKQSNYIAKHLKKTYPAHVDRFDQNLSQLQGRLDELESAMEQLRELSPENSSIVLTAGSQFDFFARAAGFSTEPLSGFKNKLQIDKELLAAVKTQLQEKFEEKFEDKLGESSGEGERKKLVLIDQRLQLTEGLSKIFLSYGIQAVPIDTLDHCSATGDYISTMKSNINRVAEAIKRPVEASD